jgi:hypothetical protein
MHNKYLILALPLVALAAGCGNGERFKTSTAIVGNGWAAPPPPYDPEPLYCYKTLGNVDCHRMPIKDGEPRLQGYYSGPTYTEEEDTSFFSFLKPLLEEDEPVDHIETVPLAPLPDKPAVE